MPTGNNRVGRTGGRDQEDPIVKPKGHPAGGKKGGRPKRPDHDERGCGTGRADQGAGLCRLIGRVAAEGGLNKVTKNEG